MKSFRNTMLKIMKQLFINKSYFIIPLLAIFVAKVLLYYTDCISAMFIITLFALCSIIYIINNENNVELTSNDIDDSDYYENN